MMPDGEFLADLHIHSRYSRACSRTLAPETIAVWAQLKGIGVVATGDITHPAWLAELDKLHRLDGHSWQDIRELVEWVVHDTGDGKGWSGWARNCQSPAKLRKPNKEGVPYYDYIRERMPRRMGRPSSDPSTWDNSDDAPLEGFDGHEDQ